MIRTILEWPPLLSALVFVVAVVVLALASYGAMRAFAGRHVYDERKDLAGSVIFRVSALHGLILALVFAQEIGNLNEADRTAAREAVVVADTFFDLERYDPDSTRDIRAALARYVDRVVSTEWSTLARDRALDLEAWDNWEAAYHGALDLAPTSARQEYLHALILDNIREISGLRMIRENDARRGVQPLFVVAALVGIVLTAASYFTYEPRRLNLGLMAIFAAYTGLVVYVIVTFANPFHAPGMVQPVGFERLLEGEIGEMVRPGT